jgi:hypothetical protein
MTTVTIVCLRLFIPQGGKSCHVEIYGRGEKKNSASEFGKQIFFLISKMEGRRIRNPKSIKSEAYR